MAGNFKVGVIGAGYWGRKHVDEYTRIGAQVTVADLKQENLDFCSEKFGAATTTDYKSLLSSKEIEFVSVCTPNSLHYPLAIEALAAGKNVLVEKPLCKTAKEGEELVALAKSKGVVLSVGHLFRFNNAVNKVREMLAAGEFGEVFMLNFKWTNLEPATPWLFSERDVIYDLAPHPFDLASFVLGAQPSQVCCSGSCLRQKEFIEAAFIDARFGATPVHVELSWVTPRKEREMVLVGSKKSAFVDLVKQKVTVVDCQNNSSTELEITANNSIQDELRHFLQSGRDVTPNSADASTGLVTIRLIEACGQSAKQGRTISL